MIFYYDFFFEYVLFSVVPEGEKLWGVPVVIGGDNLPSPVRIGLTDLENIGGPPGPPPRSGITAFEQI